MSDAVSVRRSVARSIVEEAVKGVGDLRCRGTGRVGGRVGEERGGGGDEGGEEGGGEVAGELLGDAEDEGLRDLGSRALGDAFLRESGVSGWRELIG